MSAHLERRGVDAVAVPHPRIPHRAVLAPRNGSAPRASVSVVVAAGGGDGRLRRLLDSLFELSSQPGFETIVIGRGEEAPAGTPDRVTWVEGERGAFRRGRANNLGAAAAGGEYLIFLDEDLEIVEPDWIEQLLLHAGLPGVGAVGPLLARPDGLVDQAGVAIGLRDPASPMLAGFPADGDGYYGALPCAREVSALSGECLLVGRGDFERGGRLQRVLSAASTRTSTSASGSPGGAASPSTRRDRASSTTAAPAARRAGTDVVDRALFVDCWYDELVRGDPYFNPGFAQQLADYVPASWRERVYRAAAPLGRR